MDKEKKEAVLSLPMFEDIDRAMLEPLIGHFILKQYERGDILWREGTEAHNFTFIVEGQVKVVKLRNDGRETILGIFDEGDAVGQIAVFQRMDYPATAIALADTVTVDIYRDHFFGTLRRSTELLESLVLAMMRRNRDLVRRVHELTTSNAEQRLAMLFEKLASKMGVRRKLDDGRMAIHVPVPLSRSDIAELINVRVETAIRIMSRWNKEGPVQTGDDGFLIVDPDALEELAMQIHPH